MAVCWYCHWGWAEPVADIWDEALKRVDYDDLTLQYGPAHVVWADENWDSAEWCLRHFEWDYPDRTRNELYATYWSLLALAALPMNVREIAPRCDEAWEHPELYPPTVPVRRP